EPGQAAVHRSGVQVAETEPRRERASDRALAGAGRPVDGDDHCETESSSSKKPGKLIPTLSASSRLTPSRETAPATAPSIAIRWSPTASTVPPRGRAGVPRTTNPSGRGSIRTPIARIAAVPDPTRSD